MLYTPLLPGAAAGTLEPRHVVVPLREQLKTHRPARSARVTGADPTRKRAARALARRPRASTLHYDQLIVALGSTSRTLPIPGLAEHAHRLQDAVRGDRAAQPPRSRALETAESLDDPRRARALPDVRVRRRRLRRARGPRRAAGLRRRRARPLPALPHAGRALRARRGARPRDARDLAERSPTSPARAARPRDRDPHEHDDRARSPTDSVELSAGEVVPTRTRRLDGRRQAAPGRRASSACRSTRAAGSHVDRYCRSRASTTCGRSATPPPCPTRPARATPSPPTAQHAIRQGRTVARNVAAALGVGGAQAPVHATRRSGVFVDMGRHQAVARRSGSAGAASPPGSSRAPTTSRSCRARSAAAPRRRLDGRLLFGRDSSELGTVWQSPEPLELSRPRAIGNEVRQLKATGRVPVF